MNDKQAKRLRRVVNEELARFGLTVGCREYADVMVGSRHGLLKNLETGEVIRGALQRRLTKGCPRDVYKRLKATHEREQRMAS